jgi:hypothetical protein
MLQHQHITSAQADNAVILLLTYIYIYTTVRQRQGLAINFQARGLKIVGLAFVGRGVGAGHSGEGIYALILNLIYYFIILFLNYFIMLFIYLFIINLVTSNCDSQIKKDNLLTFLPL